MRAAFISTVHEVSVIGPFLSQDAMAVIALGAPRVRRLPRMLNRPKGTRTRDQLLWQAVPPSDRFGSPANRISPKFIAENP